MLSSHPDLGPLPFAVLFQRSQLARPPTGSKGHWVQANRRYLDFLSAVDDPTNWIQQVNKISRPVKDARRSYRGFNLFSPDDEAVFHAIAQGGVQGFGIRNNDLRALLGKTSSQVSRILKRLRNHGVIKKAANTYKYYLSKLGRQVVATSRKLKQLFIIPSFRGEMHFA